VKAQRDPAEDWTEADAICNPGEVEYQREMLSHRIDAYLRKAGWDYTSNTPGCVWLWTRTIGDRVLLVNRETALRIQENL
jgi:hypothetical protein